MIIIKDTPNYAQKLRAALLVLEAGAVAFNPLNKRHNPGAATLSPEATAVLFDFICTVVPPHTLRLAFGDHGENLTADQIVSGYPEGEAKENTIKANGVTIDIDDAYNTPPGKKVRGLDEKGNVVKVDNPLARGRIIQDFNGCWVPSICVPDNENDKPDPRAARDTAVFSGGWLSGHEMTQGKKPPVENKEQDPAVAALVLATALRKGSYDRLVEDQPALATALETAVDAGNTLNDIKHIISTSVYNEGMKNWLMEAAKYLAGVEYLEENS